MSDAKKIMEMIKENDITFVDLRFTDPRGKMQHVTQHIDTIDEESLAEGFMFDGSSIAGWKAINESDMTLMPDLYRAYIDPFFAQRIGVGHFIAYDKFVVKHIQMPRAGMQINRFNRIAADKMNAVKILAKLDQIGAGFPRSGHFCAGFNIPIAGRL